KRTIAKRPLRPPLDVLTAAVLAPPSVSLRSSFPVRADTRVRARRRLDHLELSLARHTRRNLRSEVRLEPCVPVRPPPALVRLGVRKPFVGAVGQPVVGPVSVLLRRGRVDHARDVARP